MDYPYNELTGQSADLEFQLHVQIKVVDSGINTDEDALIRAMQDYMVGLPGVATVTANRLAVGSTPIPEV